MSDTPRIDAAQIFFGWNPDEGEMFVPADKSKQLERELAKAQEQLDRLADFARDVAATSSSTRLRRLAKQALAAVKGENNE